MAWGTVWNTNYRSLFYRKYLNLIVLTGIKKFILIVDFDNVSKQFDWLDFCQFNGSAWRIEVKIGRSSAIYQSYKSIFCIKEDCLIDLPIISKLYYQYCWAILIQFNNFDWGVLISLNDEESTIATEGNRLSQIGDLAIIYKLICEIWRKNVSRWIEKNSNMRLFVPENEKHLIRRSYSFIV